MLESILSDVNLGETIIRDLHILRYKGEKNLRNMFAYNFDF